MTCLGEIAIRRGDFAAAHAALNEALALGRTVGSYWRVMVVRASFGDLAVAEGKPGEALRLYRETLPILLQRGIFAHPQGSLRLACSAPKQTRFDQPLALCETIWVIEPKEPNSNASFWSKRFDHGINDLKMLLPNL